MFDNTFNNSKENIDNEGNLYSNNNNNNNYNPSSNNNRFQGSVNNKSNWPTNNGNVSSDINRFGSNIIHDPSQHFRNSYTPLVNNRFQDNGINNNASFTNGNPIPTNFNRNNFASNNINSSQPNSNLNNNQNNINTQPNINQNYLNQNSNNVNNTQNFTPNNLNNNQNNINGQPNINQNYLNQNPNNINGQPNINQNYLNQNPNNLNVSQNFTPNNLFQNSNNVNNTQNFKSSNLNQNLNNFNGHPNFNRNNLNPNNVTASQNFNPNNLNQMPNNFNPQPNFNRNNLNQMPNNFNPQPNFNRNNLNPNNINTQPSFSLNNSNQMPNNFNPQPSFSPNNLNQIPNNFNPQPSFNRNNLNPNNANSQPSFSSHNSNQIPNNFNVQPNFNRNNLNPNNANTQPSFSPNNLNQMPNNFNPQSNFNRNNQNQNNINGQPNLNPNNLNQNLNNINGQPNLNPNYLNQNNINGQQNFNPNHLNQNNVNAPQNVNQNNLDQNTNNVNASQNINPNSLNQNIDNVNSPQNINANNLDQNQNNINEQQNINPNNLDQNINNIDNQPNIDASNPNDTTIAENATSPTDDVTSEKDESLKNALTTESDDSLNEKPLETDKVKSTYNPRSKKRIALITLTSILGTSALVAAIAVPIALIAPSNSSATQPITARVSYDLDTKNVKLIVENNKLPQDISLYSVFRETLDKTFEPVQQTITLLPVGNSEIDLDFTDTNFTIYSVYKVKINDGTVDGIEVISIPTQNIKMPKISIISQSQSQTLSSSATTTTLSVTGNVSINPIPNQGLLYQWKSCDTNSINETDWIPIVNETKSTYTYDTTNLTTGVKKYFKCTLNYKYANSITSTPIYIEKANNQPVITITSHPLSQVLVNNATTATPLSVTASIQHGQANLITYQWQISNNATSGFTNINNATLSIYSLTPSEISSITPTVSKCFKCIVTHTGAVQQESNVATISKAGQSTINITTNPRAENILTSGSLNFSLEANATITNPIPNHPTPTFQWQSSSSENGTYEDINGATNKIFTKTLDANKNGWRDTWYKCNVTYPGATLASTSKGLVKMTLTTDEAKVELFKWLAVEANAKRILTEFLNSAAASNADKKWFYGSLHDHHFPEGFPNTTVQSITVSSTGVTSVYPVDYKTFTIKLITSTQVNIPTKPSGSSYNATTSILPVGTIIEFNTLFSFGEIAAQFVNQDDSKYNMLLEPTFGTGNTRSTAIAWTSTGTAPSTTTPYKKGNYPVKFYTPNDLNTPAIVDSILLASRIQAVNNTNYTFIPTYYIRSAN